MSGTYPVVMGDRGRLVVPVELRDRLHFDVGTPLLLVDTPGGVILATREQVKRLVRENLQDAGLVGQLLTERRALSALEDAG